MPIFTQHINDRKLHYRVRKAGEPDYTVSVESGRFADNGDSAVHVSLGSALQIFTDLAQAEDFARIVAEILDRMPMKDQDACAREAWTAGLALLAKGPAYVPPGVWVTSFIPTRWTDPSDPSTYSAWTMSGGGRVELGAGRWAAYDKDGTKLRDFDTASEAKTFLSQYSLTHEN
jgi:hypothetical protein